MTLQQAAWFDVFSAQDWQCPARRTKYVNYSQLRSCSQYWAVLWQTLSVTSCTWNDMFYFLHVFASDTAATLQPRFKYSQWTTNYSGTVRRITASYGHVVQQSCGSRWALCHLREMISFIFSCLDEWHMIGDCLMSVFSALSRPLVSEAPYKILVTLFITLWRVERVLWQVDRMTSWLQASWYWWLWWIRW